MCGILGFWEKGDQGTASEAVTRGLDLLRHRGPDDQGISMGDGICIGHCRLAVIDLSAAGRQPMSTVDERYHLAFNGEIYNYQQLRKDYLSHVDFKTETDTEVLLYLLIDKGVAALDLVRGMFALALWDAEKKELLLARDPFGKKPLYYYQHDGLFGFASEVQALASHPDISLQPDERSLTQYFLYEYVPSPASGFVGISQVPMGSYMRIYDDGVAVERYWKPQYLPKRVINESEAIGQLDTLLAQAVERRLVADVPVGLLLSGGLDSSTMAWYMRRQSAGNLHSFSVSFAEDTFDESRYAREVATSLALTHHELPFSVDTFRDEVEQLQQLVDIPLADASLLPTHAISRLAKEYVTVVLDGDGSDELLGGYGTFAAALLSEKIPVSVQRGLSHLQPLLDMLPTSYGNFSWDFKLKAFVRGLAYLLPERNQIWLGSFQATELSQLLQPHWHEHITHLFDPIDALSQEIESLNVTDAISALTLAHYMHNGILTKLDRATMYEGLEARTPFLDVEVAEFLMKLPAHFKRDKILLKKLMRGRIPDSIIDRPKKGFGIPLGFWLRGELYGWARDVLSEEKIQADGVFEYRYIDQLLAEHKSGRADHRKKLWTLLAWQLWFDRDDNVVRSVANLELKRTRATI